MADFLRISTRKVERVKKRFVEEANIHTSVSVAMFQFVDNVWIIGRVRGGGFRDLEPRCRVPDWLGRILPLPASGAARHPDSGVKKTIRRHAVETQMA